MSQANEDRRREVRGILSQFHESGLTQRQFAKQEGVSVSTLAYWLRRERLERELAGASALVEVTPPEPHATSGGFILEHDGFRIEIPRNVTVDEWRCLRDAWAS